MSPILQLVLCDILCFLCILLNTYSGQSDNRKVILEGPKESPFTSLLHKSKLQLTPPPQGRAGGGRASRTWTFPRDRSVRAVNMWAFCLLYPYCMLLSVIS
ncbi:hypothetical protein GDO78_014266 [Eleutherodactylus coqui]|uniref:Uncharacterized protein n=1 Tax=Eleutherodactylus coqui TaxID=57060 RepID=A0A8J6E8Y0_ELECQ|nr:hypothetical protein GDO78_014266 [Eleutherodactylus coqui]